MKKMIAIALLLTGSVMLAGCPKKHNVNDVPVAGTQVPSGTGGSSSEGASTSGSALGGDAAGNSAKGLAGELNAGPNSKRIIYFDFDKSEIKPEFADIVSGAARQLTSNAGLRLKLEGNTDNRGTREYNIGLGERRAQAVRRALMLQGVGAAQLQTVSFGAERPAAEGDDDAAWSQNRRVELVYAQ
jgi:peptidoglycan-associated lipoprotein